VGRERVNRAPCAVNRERRIARSLRLTVHASTVYKPRICYSEFNKEPCAMHISSPFVVVPVILIVFVVSILFSTSSKEDKPSTH
jgi:hypothetical protein